MPKQSPKSRLERAAVRLRGGSDFERSIYVTLRKALAPRVTATRRNAVRASAHDGFEIPRDKGFALIPPGRFPEADEVAREAIARFETLGPEALEREKQRKQFMIPIVEQSELGRESALMRLATRPDVLSAVTKYLGMAPLLTNLNVYVSKSSERELMSSQLFHCDADDTAQIKVFVLCSEVGEQNGPLMIMDAETSRELRRKVGYRYRSRVEDEEARAALGDFELTAVTGEPGTVCFVDTSRCFHYGSRVSGQGEPRVAAMIQYLTPHSFMLPRAAADGAPFRSLAREDDPRLTKLALGA